jgi:hypothetical protein
MAIEVGIWRMGEKWERVTVSALDAEKTLEDQIVRDLSILAPQLLLLGRQVPTAFGKFIDIVAIDPNGTVVVVELKRDRTPRDVVAQLLDYASWIQSLSHEEIAEIFAANHDGQEFEKGFFEAFGTNPPEAINQAHDLIVISSDLDPSTERIINYLADNYGVPINAVSFRCFRDGDRQYLARTWLIDPAEAEAKKATGAARAGREQWNGRDFYVSFGDGDRRSWEDAVKYGFVSGGGGRWYSQTLKLLFPGSRVFVNIPKAGYVGVGTVKESVVPVSQFLVSLNGGNVPLLSAPVHDLRMGEDAGDPELSEYLVRVEWIKTVSKSDAYWEKGLFAIQHTACRLRNNFTIENVSRHFGIET